MHELVLRLPESLVEAVSEALVDELEALSVSVADADAGTDAEQALFGEPGMPVPREGWQRSDVTALFANEAEATEAATLLLAQDWAADMSVLALREVADQDWVRLTQSQFAPVEVTPSFWIVPSWHEAPAAARTVIRLDPGLAFGTGTHNCLGIHLAKRELRIVVEEFLARFRNIRIKPGEKRRYHTGRTFGMEYLPLVWDKV